MQRRGIETGIRWATVAGLLTVAAACDFQSPLTDTAPTRPPAAGQAKPKDPLPPTPTVIPEHVIEQAAKAIPTPIGGQKEINWLEPFSYPDQMNDDERAAYTLQKFVRTSFLMESSLNQIMKGAARKTQSSSNPGGIPVGAVPTQGKRVPLEIEARRVPGNNAPVFYIVFNGTALDAPFLYIGIELVGATATIDKLHQQYAAANRSLPLEDRLASILQSQPLQVQRTAHAQAQMARAIIEQKALGSTEGIPKEHLEHAARFVLVGQNEQSPAWGQYVRGVLEAQSRPQPTPQGRKA